MSAFHPLTVVDVRPETTDTISVAFEVPSELCAAYRFQPGQHVALRHRVNGRQVRRAYSICSAPHEGELRIAIKKVEGGLFSTFAHTALSPGMTLEVGRPAGRFAPALDAASARMYAAFAAGSGITPIISIIKCILAEEPKSRVVLFYGNRDPSAVIFREQLQELKNRHVSRLSVHHVFSATGAGSSPLQGRLDGAKVNQFAGTACPPHAVHRYFVCGPATMGEEARAALLDLGAAPDQILIERFTPGARPVPLRQRPTPPVSMPQSGTASAVTTVADGQRNTFEVAFDGEAVIDAAARQAVDLPYACKAGVCGACRARVVEGEARMTANHALDPHEVEAGFVLACQTQPLDSRLVLDFDRAWSGAAELSA